jgi:hypothetical protein
MRYWRLVIILLLFIIFSGLYLTTRPKTFEQNREEIILSLNSAIAKAKDSGDYHCCIEPACKMCYLGNWIFEDGKCDCDKYVASGEFDKVCPECKKSLSCSESGGNFSSEQ